jgi:hypothetical protein
MAKTAENCDDNWLYEYDRTKPLLSQTVYNHPNGSILNISKIYTNNVYFGINTFIAIDKQILRVLKCKDHGIPENKVNDEIYVINIVKRYLERAKDNRYSIDYNYINVETTTINIDLPKVNNNSPIVQFCFREGEYLFTNILIGDTVNRSLYADVADNWEALEPSHQRTHLPKGQLPTKDRISQFYEETKYALSNVYTYINTDYSQIKVYRKEL